MLKKSVFSTALIALAVGLLPQAHAIGTFAPGDPCLAPLVAGTLNQLNPELRKAGLFSEQNPNMSMICGPVCLVNLMKHVRSLRGLGNPDPIFEMELLLKTLPTHLGITLDNLRENGMMAYDLKKLVDWYFSYLGFPSKVTVKGLEVSRESLGDEKSYQRKPILPKDLQVSQKNLVILDYEVFDDVNIDYVLPRDESEGSGWHFGHFVVLTDFAASPGQPGVYRARFNDPQFGSKVNAELRQVEPKLYRIPTFEITKLSAPESMKNKKILVTNIVRIEF